MNNFLQKRWIYKLESMTNCNDMTKYRKTKKKEEKTNISIQNKTY